MLLSRSARLKVLVVLTTFQCILCSGEAGEKDGYFSIKLSNGGRAWYFRYERIFMVAEIANSTGGELRFMPTLAPQRGDFMSGAHVDLFIDGKEEPLQMQAGAEGPWGRAIWEAWMVRAMDSGRKLSSKFCLTEMYGSPDPGHYHAVARISQEGPKEWRLATGKAVSAPLSFEVKDWEARALIERRVSRKLNDKMLETAISIVETKDGSLLACWKTGFAREPERHAEVVPVQVRGPLNQLLWSATEEKCYIAYPGAKGQGMQLAVADRWACEVTYMTLEGPATGGDKAAKEP
jgi:hypothetical protein